METPIHEIKINADISFPSPHVIVMLPGCMKSLWVKRRTTLIRTRVIVLGKAWTMHFWASALTTVAAPSVTALGDAATDADSPQSWGWYQESAWKPWPSFFWTENKVGYHQTSNAFPLAWCCSFQVILGSKQIWLCMVVAPRYYSNCL